MGDKPGNQTVRTRKRASITVDLKRLAMRISDDEQTYKDFDWYCVDGQGCVGHFASAGFKKLPPSVAASAEELSFLDAFFNQVNSAPDAHELDDQLRPDQRTERYLRSFIAMADRGLYSFDIESYLRPEICYFRVAIPKAPLRFIDLPDPVRLVLGRTALTGHLLERCSAIPYSETLTL